MTPVTDPDLLAQLNGGAVQAPQGFRPVTDPALLAQLNGPAQPQAEQPGMLDQIGRQLGLTARYGMEGAGNLANLVTEPIRQNVTDPLARMMSGGPNLSDLITGNQAPQGESTGDAMSRLADSLGLPKPQGSLEQGVGEASKALVGTGLSAGAGLAAGAPQLAAQPLMQAMSTLSGSGAQQAAQAADMGPAGQTVAGLVGGLLPGAGAGAQGALRMAMRGGEGGRANMANNIENFAAAGTTPSVGQASQSAIPQYLESLLAKVPGGASVMAKKAATQADEIGAGLASKANAMAPGADAEMAGSAIQRGITGDGGYVSRFKETASKLYDALDKHVPPQTPMEVKATKAYLQKAVSPTKGAENTSSLLVNPKLKEIDAALSADLEAAASGTLPYEAVKSLRSRVGAMQADAGLTPDIPKSELKRLYGALSDDMKAQAYKTPEGAKAFNRSANFYKAGIDKIDKIEHVVTKAGGPEKVFSAAMSGTNEGATTLRNVMSSLKSSERDVVSATVMNRMGKATAGQQGVDAEGMADRFSTSTLLTNWSKMSPQARSVLFSHKGPQFKSDMDHLAKVATNLRDGSKVFANPSGTSQGIAQIGTVAGAVSAALSGNVGGLALLGAGVGGANLSARLMTNPKFVGWLAKQTNRPASSIRGQIGVLANIGKEDPDIQEFTEAMKAQ